jgi:hypothetical protein
MVDRSSFVKGYTKILTNAWSDENFAQELKADPKPILAEYGLDVPADATVDVVSSQGTEGSVDDQVKIWDEGASSGHYTLYVPSVPQVEAGELSEAELEGVAGAGNVDACCCCCPCCTST